MLRIKVGLAVTGLGLGLVGMSRHTPALVWGAVGCLAAAFLLRFAGRR